MSAMDVDYKVDPIDRRVKRKYAGGSSDKRVKRAIALSYKYPYSTYGRMKRGTPLGLQAFGATYKLANEAQRARRKELGYIGRGKYMRGRGGYFGKLIGTALGGKKLGKLFSSAGDMMFDGSRIGSALDAAGKMIGRGMYTGQGSYSSSVDNSLIHGDTLGVPHFQGEQDGGRVTVCHREFIGNIYAPALLAPFSVQTYRINPGLESTFPWLAQIAANYEEYEMKQLIFTYRSTVADFASASGQVGQVLMATQYNNNKDPFYEKVTMMQYDGAMSGKTSETQLHGVECDPAKLSGHPGKYVRVAPVLPDEDLNDYDHAQFNIAVADAPSTYANQALGELWVSYTVELRKPKFFTGRGLAISRDSFLTLSGTNTNPFNGSNNLTAQSNNIGCRFIRASTATSGLIIFPAGWSGNVEVRVIVSDAPEGLGQALGLTTTLTGNIARIADIVAGGGQGDRYRSEIAALDINGPAPLPSSANPKFIYIGHFRIQNATNGIENTLRLAWIGNAASTVQQTEVDIQEYNMGFNFRLDGSNDKIRWINDDGSVANVV